MRRFAVECFIPVYDVLTVVVDAPGLETACAKALDEAMVSPDWQRMDDCGDTYIVAIAEAPDEDDLVEALDTSKLSVPPEYSEPETRPNIEIIVEDGDIQDVIVTNGQAEIKIVHRTSGQI